MSKPRPKRRRDAAPKSSGRTMIALLVVGAAVVLILAGKGLLSPKATEVLPPLDLDLPPGELLDQALAQKRVAFVLFHSTTCIPCREMEKVAADVLPEFEGQVVTVDVLVSDRANMELIQRMAIRAIPTTFIFDRTGQRRMFLGAISRDMLRSELQAVLAR